MSKNNIDHNVLNISEAIYLVNEITCENIKKSSYELLSFLDEKSKRIDNIRECLENINYVPALNEIYDDISKLYENYIDSKKSKNQKSKL